MRTTFSDVVLTIGFLCLIYFIRDVSVTLFLSKEDDTGLKEREVQLNQAVTCSIKRETARPDFDERLNKINTSRQE